MRSTVAVLLVVQVGLAADASCAGCSNDCNDAEVFAMRGTCDDGGPVAATSICRLGTDSDDCGCSADRCGGGVERRVGSLNPTPQTAEMTRRLGASEGAHRVSRREVDRRRGRRKLQQICCTRLRLFLGEDESIAYVAGEKLHSGFPVYQRDPASGRIDGMPAADLYRNSRRSSVGAAARGPSGALEGSSTAGRPSLRARRTVSASLATRIPQAGGRPTRRPRRAGVTSRTCTSSATTHRTSRSRRRRLHLRPRHHPRSLRRRRPSAAGGVGSIASMARHATCRASSARRGSSVTAATYRRHRLRRRHRGNGPGFLRPTRRATPGSRRRRPTPPTDGRITTQR